MLLIDIKMSKLYHVVKFFNKNDSVEAVPTTWVGCWVCKWPNYNADRLRSAIKSHEKIDTHDISKKRLHHVNLLLLPDDNLSQVDYRYKHAAAFSQPAYESEILLQLLLA